MVGGRVAWGNTDRGARVRLNAVGASEVGANAVVGYGMAECDLAWHRPSLSRTYVLRHHYVSLRVKFH